MWKPRSMCPVVGKRKNSHGLQGNSIKAGLTKVTLQGFYPPWAMCCLERRQTAERERETNRQQPNALACDGRERERRGETLSVCSPRSPHLFFFFFFFKALRCYELPVLHQTRCSHNNHNQSKPTESRLPIPAAAAAPLPSDCCAQLHHALSNFA